jgi:chitinase
MENYLVVGFLPGYQTSEQHGYNIDNAPGDQLTHLIYCFAGFEQNGTVWQATTPEPKDTTKNFPKLLALKQKYPMLSLMMSIGGYNNSQKQTNGATIFSTIAADQVLRKAFVQSCLDTFILRSPPLFDGIDVDWEFPDPEDQANFTLLIREFRDQLNALGRQQSRHFTLTLSIKAGPTNIDLANLQISLDWLHVMTYNFHAPTMNASNKVTNFNAPILGSPNDPTPGINIDTFIQALLGLGMNSRKLVLGIPAYAHAYAGVDSTNGGLYQSYTGPGPGTYTPGSGMLTYKDVMDNYLTTCGPPGWDDFTESSSMYCATDRIWISPNMAGDVYAKASYVMKHNLGGLMLWELGADTINQYSLAEQMSASLHHTIE